MKVLNFNFSPKHLFTARGSDYLRSLEFLFLCYRAGQTVTSVCVMPAQLCKHIFFSTLFTERQAVSQGQFRKQITVPSMWGYVFETTIFSARTGDSLAEYILKSACICQYMEIRRNLPVYTDEKKKIPSKSVRTLKW